MWTTQMNLTYTFIKDYDLVRLSKKLFSTKNYFRIKEYILTYK